MYFFTYKSYIIIYRKIRRKTHLIGRYQVKNYVKTYPRPQFVRKEWEILNGEWDFIFDEYNEGEDKEYFVNFPKENNKIQVPFTYETQLSGIQDESVHNVVWYHKEITISKNQLENKKIVLHFEGSDYLTKVWINGKYVGTHEGGYSRFSFDIENYLELGENEITVKVEDSLAKEQPRGKQRYKKESWKCWYVQTTGIWKTVWLEFLSMQYIRSVKNTPDLDTKTIKLEYETNITEKEFENYQFYIETEISFNGKIVNNSKILLQNAYQEVILPICQENVQHEIQKWSPDTPHLYEITYTLYCEDKMIDTVYSYFGIRKIEIQKNKILLNDKELYLKLILDQGYWKQSHLTPPNEEAIIKDIDIALEYGYNGIRKHQKVEDERFLYWCDVKGVLVWSEMANCYAFNDKSVQNFTEQWIKVVKQNYNHPSIIAWVPINESWGVPEIAKDRKQQNFVNSIYYITKALDSTRPVISNDGWEHTISDIITIHDYKQDSELLSSEYMDKERKVLNNIKEYNSHHKLFAEGYTYTGQPVIMSEYGGTALNAEKGWGYGNQVKDEMDFVERFYALADVIKSIPYMTGYCYTQLTDVQQEINGLVDENRKDKFSDKVKKKIKEINKNTN